MVSSINVVKVIFLGAIYHLQLELGTALPPGDEDKCENDSKFRVTHNSIEYKCQDLKGGAESAPHEDEARAYLCMFHEEVGEKCKLSCGLCCHDNDEYTFSLGGDEDLSCADINPQDPSSIDEFCPLKTNNGKKKKTVRNVCPLSCDNCNVPVLSAPPAVDNGDENPLPVTKEPKQSKEPKTPSESDSDDNSKSKSKDKSPPSESDSDDTPTMAPSSAGDDTDNDKDLLGVAPALTDRDSAGNAMRFATSVTLILILSLFGF